jgi:hypothetical protein
MRYMRFESKLFGLLVYSIGQFDCLVELGFLRWTFDVDYAQRLDPRPFKCP